MKENSLALSFNDSLTEDVSNIVGEYAEIGLDALMEESLEEGVFKDIPIVSTAVAVYKIGKSIRERHHLAKLIAFVDEMNKGILSNEKRQRYRKKFSANEKFRNQELVYILVLVDRYINFDKPRMLAKLYLAYLDGAFEWIEFIKYAEIIDRFLPGDLEELEKGNQYNVHQTTVSDALLRLISCGFLMEVSKGVTAPTTLGSISIPPATEKDYIITKFGKKFLDVVC